MSKRIVELGIALVMVLWMVGESRGQTVGVNWAVDGGGATESEYPSGIALDAAGNTYITGAFYQTAVFGNFTLTGNAPTHHVFVVKYDPTGNVVWAKAIVNGWLGGSFLREGNIAVDDAQNVYVTGEFSGGIQIGSTTLNSSGGDDFFIAKFDPNGSLQWTRTPGSGPGSIDADIHLEKNGGYYMTGQFNGTATFDSLTLVHIDTLSTESFVARFNSAGGLIWLQRFTGTSNVGMGSISVDSSRYAYVTGHFEDTMSIGATILISQGYYDLYYAKFSPSGNLVWMKQAGGTSFDYGPSISVDGKGSFYMVMQVLPPVTIDTITLSGHGSYGDVAIIKCDTSGNVLWAKRIGGPDLDGAYQMAFDATGNGYLTGFFRDSIELAGQTFTTGSIQVHNAFTLKMDAAGNELEAYQFVSTTRSGGAAIVVDAIGNYYIVGHYNLTTTFGSFPLTSSGDDDVFLVKIGSKSVAASSTLTTSSFTLSPNPARFQVRLTNLTQPTRCTLYNLLGQPVLMQALPVSATEATLPLRGLAPGLYMLQVQSAGGIRSEKLVLE